MKKIKKKLNLLSKNAKIFDIEMLKQLYYL